MRYYMKLVEDKKYTNTDIENASEQHRKYKALRHFLRLHDNIKQE